MNPKLWIGIVVFIMLGIGCERITRPRLTESAEIELKALAGLVTEAYLRIDVKQLPSNSVIKIYRNGALWLEGSYSALDSVLHDEGLTPGSSVVYRAEVEKAGEVIGRSDEVRIQLKPTTSHDVTWYIYEFESIGGGGRFFDVAIVNKNDIWVVGEIYHGYDLVNALHWDGSGWEEIRIQTNACGGVDYPSIKCVNKLEDGTVIFGHEDASITFYKNRKYENDCSYINEIGAGLWSMFVRDSDHIYIGANKGEISLFNGNKWKKLFSIPELFIQTIWSSNNENNISEVFALASDFYRHPGSWLIKIEGEEASIIADSAEIPRGMAGLWFSSGKEYWLVGDGVLRSRLSPHNWQGFRDFPRYFSHAIAATDINDVWVVGAYGLVSHYNGESWHHYGGRKLPPHGLLLSVAVTRDVIIAVGTKSSKGYIVMGQRQN